MKPIAGRTTSEMPPAHASLSLSPNTASKYRWQRFVHCYRQECGEESAGRDHRRLYGDVNIPPLFPIQTFFLQKSINLFRCLARWWLREAYQIRVVPGKFTGSFPTTLVYCFDHNLLTALFTNQIEIARCI